MEQEIVRCYNRNTYLSQRRAPPAGVCNILSWQNMSPEQLKTEVYIKLTLYYLYAPSLSHMLCWPSANVDFWFQKRKLTQKRYCERDKSLLSSPEEIRNKYNKLKV